MNLIDPIRHYLSRINPDMDSWRVSCHSNRLKRMSMRAHNKMKHSGRMVDFYILFNADLITCDIALTKIVFNQDRGAKSINNNTTRKRLVSEMMEKLSYGALPNELERAVNIILSVNKEMQSIGKD